MVSIAVFAHSACEALTSLSGIAALMRSIRAIRSLCVSACSGLGNCTKGSAFPVKPSSPFYSDILTLRMLEFFSGYPVQTSWIDFESINSTGELKPGSMVMVNKRYIAWLDKNGGMWLSKRSGYRKHEFYDHPPQTWRRIYESSNAVLYQLS